MQPVLFLDIDGVLNHSAWFDHLYERLALAEVILPHHKLDPVCVARLNRLLSLAGGPHVVISSMWRAIHGRDATERALREAGVKAHVVGVTPQLQRDLWGRGENLYVAAPRWHEIRRWLDEHPGHGPVCILDDEPDMGEL